MRHERQRTAVVTRSAATMEPSGGQPTHVYGPTRVLRFQAVRDRTGLSRSTIWRLERRGTFPRHRRISLNAVGWIEHEVDAWIQSRTT